MHLLILKFKYFLSGLQIGFYLERAARDYIIFERDGLAGILSKDSGTLLLKARFNVNMSYSKTQF